MSIKDEFDFIKNITPKGGKTSPLVVGIGDDAAMFKGDSNNDEIVCMDTMVEGIHFNSKTMSPFHIGFKALAANISDVAAMGGRPLFYLVSLAIPPSWKEEYLYDIYKGMDKVASLYEMELIGGDTVSTNDKLVITITAIGRAETGTRLLRSNAQVGDVLFVTGTIGDSAAGLHLLLDNGLHHSYSNDESYLISRHQTPPPRVAVGRFLTTCKNVSLNDVSDGLASEANEIATASDKSIFIEKEALPKSKEMQMFPKEKQDHWMLFGGEDYELIGTIGEDEWHHLQLFSKKEQIRITKIGYVKEGPAVVYLKENEKLSILHKNGYNHFSYFKKD